MRVEDLVANGVYTSRDSIDPVDDDEDVAQRQRRIDEIMSEMKDMTKEEISAMFFRAFPEEAHDSGMDYHIPASQLVANFFDRDACKATLPISLVKQGVALKEAEEKTTQMLAETSGELSPHLAKISAQLVEIGTNKERKELKKKIQDNLLERLNE